MPRQVRVAEERYLRSPEAQLERLAGKTAGAWPCPLQREIEIRGGLAQRTAATAAAAAKVAAAVARPGEGRLLGSSGAPVLLRLGTAAFAMLAEASLALEVDSPRAPQGEVVVTREVERVATQAALLQRSDSFYANVGRGAPALLNAPPMKGVPRFLPSAMPAPGSHRQSIDASIVAGHSKYSLTEHGIAAGLKPWPWPSCRPASLALLLAKPDNLRLTSYVLLLTSYFLRQQACRPHPGKWTRGARRSRSRVARITSPWAGGTLPLQKELLLRRSRG